MIEPAGFTCKCPFHILKSYRRMLAIQSPGVHLIPRLDIVKTLNILFTLNTPHTQRFWLPLNDGLRLAVAFQSRGTFLLKCQGDMKQSPITPDQMTDIIYIQSILKRVKLFRI